jgi:hypothetical protein
METESTSELSGERLARLLSLGTGDDRTAEPALPEDATARRLRERLAAPIPLDPADPESAPVLLGRAYPELAPVAGRPLAEVLLDSTSDPRVIETIKGFAKRLDARSAEDTGHAVTVTIYYAAIAAALVFRDRKITTRSYESLTRSFAMLIEKPWMVPELKRLFAKARGVCAERRA